MVESLYPPLNRKRPQNLASVATFHLYRSYNGRQLQRTVEGPEPVRASSRHLCPVTRTWVPFRKRAVPPYPGGSDLTAALLVQRREDRSSTASTLVGRAAQVTGRLGFVRVQAAGERWRPGRRWRRAAAEEEAQQLNCIRDVNAVFSPGGRDISSSTISWRILIRANGCLR